MSQGPARPFDFSMDAGDLTGAVLASNVITSSLTAVGALVAGSIVAGFSGIDGTPIGAADPSTAAFTNVTTDYIQLNATPTPPAYAEGQIYWDQADKTLLVRTDVEEVSLQVGQEMHARATNKTGVQIDNGEIVYVSGAQGDRPTVAPASASTSSEAKALLGIATHDIINNATGFVTLFGLVRDLDTDAFSEGATLYLSTTAGEFTDTMPTSPNQNVRIGTVLRSHSTEGIVLFDQVRGPDLSELSDVLISGVADQDVIRWVSANSRWEAGQALDTAGGTISGTLAVTGNAFFGTATDTRGIALLKDGGAGAVGLDLHNLGTNAADDVQVNFETNGQIEWAIGIDRSTSGDFLIGRSGTLGSNIAMTFSNDAQPNTTILGTLFLGAADTNLYRASANVLKTDDAFVVGGTLGVTGNVGIGAAPSANAGLLVEDGRLMLKESGEPTADAGYGKLYTKGDDKFYFQDGSGVEHTVNVTGESIVFKSYSMGDFGTADIHYLAGFYDAPDAHVVLTIGGTVVQTFGTAGRMKAAHAFVVASGAGGTDLVLTVTGISIGEDGSRNDADSEVIVADTDAASTDQYFETTKKWLGQITYTLTGSSGAFTFNYGFAKYDDFGNRVHILTDFEMVLLGGGSETGFDVQLLHHKATGWTYHASAFVPGTGALVSSLADNSATNDNFGTGDEVAYKRVGLNVPVAGGAGEGTLIKVVTANNNSISAGTCHIGVIV